MNILDYESVVKYIDEHIELAVGSLRVGEWLLECEDGILKALTEARFSFPTKKAAIEEFGERCMDSRRVPKVRKVGKGHYQYFVKDCDFGHDREPVGVIRLTSENIDWYRQMLKDDLEGVRDEMILPLYSNPLFEDDYLEKAIKESVCLEIYDSGEG